MLRRTNIFNISSTLDTFPENAFLNLSNWSEDITGYYLNAATSCYPSSFLALNIDLTTNFINLINKLKDVESKNTYLRDYRQVLTSVKDFDKYLSEGADLIYWLLKNRAVVDKTATPIIRGNIGEQDYNGTFTDIICTIDANNYGYTVNDIDYTNLYNTTSMIELPTGGINDKTLLKEFPTGSVLEPTSVLHGWQVDGSTGKPWEYAVNYDGEITNTLSTGGTVVNKLYYNKLNSDRVSFTAIDAKESTLTFNVIIPFYKVGTSTVKNDTTDLSSIIFNNVSDVKEIPLGIWITKTPIVLKRKESTFYGYNPSWSLSIATQIKPFPSSDLLQVETTDAADVIITQQNFSELFKKISELTKISLNNQKQIIKLNKDLSIINTQLQQFGGGTVTTDWALINELKTKINDLNTELATQKLAIIELQAATKKQLIWS
jgi:hypothetical protein